MAEWIELLPFCELLTAGELTLRDKFRGRAAGTHSGVEFLALKRGRLHVQFSDGRALWVPVRLVKTKERAEQ